MGTCPALSKVENEFSDRKPLLGGAHGDDEDGEVDSSLICRPPDLRWPRLPRAPAMNERMRSSTCATRCVEVIQCKLDPVASDRAVAASAAVTCAAPGMPRPSSSITAMRRLISAMTLRANGPR